MNPSPRQLHPAMTSHDVVVGVAWGIGAAACHSVVPIAVRMLSSHIPTVELVFFRNLIGLGILLSIVSWRGFGFLRTARIGAHLQRNLLNFAGMWLWFVGLSALPLAKAVALHFTLPLMVVPLAIVFLREKPGPIRIVCTLIGFAGVLVILRPGAAPIGPAALLVLAVAGTAAPYCLVRGMVHAEATIVEPLEYLRLPFTAALAWVLFAETTDGWTWAGAAVIAAATWYMARHEHRAAAG